MNRGQWSLLILLLLAATAGRLFFVWWQPFTNDEGSYLYDAKLIAEGRVPGGDVLAKSPVAIGIFALSVWLTGGSLDAARYASVAASMGTTLLLAGIGYYLGGKKMAWLAAVLWSLGSGPIFFHALGHTEAVAAFWTSLALLLWLVATQRNIFIITRIPAHWLALAAGAAFAIAFASRKSALALVVPMLLCLWLSHNNRRLVAWSIAGALAALAPWLLLMHSLYGWVGVQHALGVEYGQLIVHGVLDPDSVTWGGGLWWSWHVVARLVSFTLGASLIGSAYLLEQYLPATLKKLGWLVAAASACVAAFALWQGDFAPPNYLLIVFWLFMAGICVYRVLGKQETTTRPELLQLLPLLWFVALGGLYLTWPTFLPDYAADLLPPLTLLGAYGVSILASSFQYRPSLIAAIGVAVTIVSLHNVAVHPWTGMFTRTAIHEAAAYLVQEVSREDQIFTAAYPVPYVSDHAVLLNVAHPFWYRYEFIDQAVLTTFLPPLSVIEESVRSGKVKWAVVEHLTDYSYLRHPSDLLGHLHSDWEMMKEIPNDTGFRSNPLQIWHRK